MMKQKVLLSIVVLAFLLVWGTVIYELFNKQDSSHLTYNDTVTEEYIVDTESELIEQAPTTSTITKNESLKEIVKTQTEINKKIQPPLNKGIDYGEGISIDDILKNLEIVMNN